jgi:hypothetical protein
MNITLHPFEVRHLLDGELFTLLGVPARLMEPSNSNYGAALVDQAMFCQRMGTRSHPTSNTRRPRSRFAGSRG